MINVKVPDLSGLLGPILRATASEPAQKIFKKALFEGAKILVARAKELAPGPNKAPRKRKGKQVKPATYGKSGALKKAIKAYFRRARKSQAAYIAVGANRDYKIPVRRGKKDMFAYPRNYVHLVERGFTAIARIPGVVGRKTNYAILRLMRRYRPGKTNAWEISFRKALALEYDKKLMSSDLKETNKFRIESYINGYKSAKRTKVAGRRFLLRAKKEKMDEAMKAATKALLAEYLKIFKGFGEAA